LALATSWKRAGKTAWPGPGDGDDAVLERLPQRLEHRALELRELVEKENASVGERFSPDENFARTFARLS
jgi:hypothetical protein